MLKYFCVTICQLLVWIEQYTVNVELVILFLLVINIELDKQFMILTFSVI